MNDSTHCSIPGQLMYFDSECNLFWLYTFDALLGLHIGRKCSCLFLQLSNPRTLKTKTFTSGNESIHRDESFV